MRTEPLTEDADVTLNGAGAGSATLTVPRLQTWRLSSVALQVSTNVKEPEGDVYINGRFIAGSFSASKDSASADQILMPGQSIRCDFSGGDSGAVATLTVFGTVEYAV